MENVGLTSTSTLFSVGFRHRLHPPHAYEASIVSLCRVGLVGELICEEHLFMVA